MLRYLVILSLFFSAFASSNDKTTTVVQSAPPNQKFNYLPSHGAYPNPTPYSQRLRSGRTYFPYYTSKTAYKAQAYVDHLNRTSGIQPQAVTKQSIARTLGKMGKKANGLPPPIKSVMLLAGAYVSNCVTQDYPSLCMSSGGPSESDVTAETESVPAKFEDNVTCNAYFNGQSLGVFTGRSFAECLTAGSSAVSSKIKLPKANESIELSPTTTINISRSFEPFPCDATTNYCAVGVRITETSSSRNCGGDANGNMTCTKSDPVITVTNVGGSVQLDKKVTMPKCPPDNHPLYTYGPYKPAGATNFRCYAATSQSVADDKFFVDALSKNPNLLDDILNSPEIGLDDFVDWETGRPYDTLIPNPSFDDVSEKFSNAAESVINGTAQSNNPSDTKTYIPQDIYNSTVNNVNQWFNGQAFVDTFTNTQVTPATPPAENGPMDWTDFPGITQGQYEKSNEAWATGAMSKVDNIDNVKAEEDSAFDQFKDFANTPTSDPKFFALADYVSLPTSGSCRGFTIDAPLSSQPITITVNQHCPPYDAWGRPLVEWFLGILTIIQLFRIFQRTLEVA